MYTNLKEERRLNENLIKRAFYNNNVKSEVNEISKG